MSASGGASPKRSEQESVSDPETFNEENWGCEPSSGCRKAPLTTRDTLIHFASHTRTLGMPITKKQSDVPGVSEEEAAKVALANQQQKLAREQAEAEKGNIVQVSSADLHNYPDASVKLPMPDPDQVKTPQPKTGAAATAKEE